MGISDESSMNFLVQSRALKSLKIASDKLEEIAEESDKSSPDPMQSCVSVAGAIYLTDKSSDGCEFTFPTDINILTGKRWDEEPEEYTHKENTISSCESKDTEMTDLSWYK
jgi:sulfur transfer protein SufE